jgi:hypothetical protein
MNQELIFCAAALWRLHKHGLYSVASEFEAEARVVQRVYQMYTVEGLSIGEITRQLNTERIPTRKASARWERSRLGPIAQPRLSRRRVLRQNPHRCADAGYAPTASARCNDAQRHSQPRTPARRVD